MNRTAVAAGFALMLAAVPVLAQNKGAPAQQAVPNWQAEPRYATINLQAGFQPDPREITVEAGGDREVINLGADCAGWIDFSKPDVDLNYTAGSFPLVISVRPASANVDTTLVINDANGRWICNDDFNGLDPVVVINNPPSGNYNIWIGTYDRSAPQRATLVVSEIPPRR